MSALLLVMGAWLLQISLAEPQSAAPPPAPPDYEVGPDDILTITVSGHDDLTQTLLVQADGSFIFSLVGRVVVAGKTVEALQKELEKLLANGFIRDPRVTVIVAEYRSKTVFVLGQIHNPGTYPLAQSGTIVELLARAGPTTESAASEILIVRPKGDVAGPLLPEQLSDDAANVPGRPQLQVIRVNLAELMAGKLEENIRLEPNDTVFIPEAPKVYVSGEVRSAGAYPVAPGTTVRQVVSLAGGLTEYASAGRMRVVREVDGKTQEFSIRMDDPVHSGDTIIVRARLF